MQAHSRLDYFLATAYSTTTLQHQLQLWRECLEYALYHTVATEVATAAAQHAHALPSTADRAIVSAWPVAIWEGVTTANFIQTHDDLLSAAATVPTQVLYVPVALDEVDIADLGQWCRANCQVTLLELKVDPRVVGGMGLVDARGQYQEVSLRTRLADGQHAITSLLSTYE